MENNISLTSGTRSSIVVDKCQVCNSSELESILFLGYIPPVNQMRPVGIRPGEQPSYPAELLFCQRCKLVQIGCIVDPGVLFPPDYPYTSGTTQILHDNFEEMVHDCNTNVERMKESDLIIDIGSNDGTLLSKWKNAGYNVYGIEPSDKAQLANDHAIPTMQAFFNRSTALEVRDKVGLAKVITATNVFAHIENIHDIVESILLLIREDGIFISESHYLMGLIETVQYDTIYHEHLRYYSLHSLKYLLDMHGLEIIYAKKIPTHGGSIRVYASRKGKFPVQDCIKDILEDEISRGVETSEALKIFARNVVLTKLKLYALLKNIKEDGGHVYGVGAPSRASTLISYTGLDNGILDCVLEIKYSHKIGKYMPGTIIPVMEESKLFIDQPAYALLLSWHIAEELMPKIRKKGFKGKFILPLPEPRIVE